MQRHGWNLSVLSEVLSSQFLWKMLCLPRGTNPLTQCFIPVACRHRCCCQIQLNANTERLFYGF